MRYTSTDALAWPCAPVALTFIIPLHLDASRQLVCVFWYALEAPGAVAAAASAVAQAADQLLPPLEAAVEHGIRLWALQSSPAAMPRPPATSSSPARSDGPRHAAADDAAAAPDAADTACALLHSDPRPTAAALLDALPAHLAEPLGRLTQPKRPIPM